MDKTGWTSAASSINKDLDKMSGMSKATAESFRKAGTIMIGIGGAIAASIFACVKKAAEFDKVSRQMDAVLKSTGSAAGITKGELLGYADALMAITANDDEAIIGAENILLTFTKIGKDIFPAAIETVLDMSQALGQDLKSSAIQLGKALQDPERGVTALRRVGVNFSTDQVKVIKALVDTGHAAEAQRLIMAELAKEFGGSARAYAQSYEGQMKSLGIQFGELKEVIGAAFLPILKDMVAVIKPIVEKMREWVQAHPELIDKIAKAALGIGGLMLALGPLVFMIPKIIGGLKDLKIALATLSGPFAIVVAGALAVGYALDKLINKYKAKQDAEMQAIVKSSGPVAEALRLRNTLIKEQIVTHEEWRDLFNKAGRDYTKMLEMISTDPAYADIKKAWDDIKGKQKEAADQADETGSAEERLAKQLQAAEEAAKKWGEALQEWGIKTLKEKQDRIGELLGYEKKLEDMFKTGKITAEDYGKGIKAISTELFDLGEKIDTALPKARDLGDIWKDAPDQVDDLVYAMTTEEEKLKDLARELGLATDETLRLAYETNRLQVFFSTGIMLPELDFGRIADDAKQTTQDTKGYFDGLYNDIASGMGSTMESFIADIASGMDFAKGIFWEHGINFKQFFEDIFGSIKTAFFRMIGEMLTDEVMGWFKNFFSSIGKAATDTMAESAKTAVGAAADITKGASAAISGLWTALGSAVGSFLGTVLAGIISGGPSGHQQEQQINDTKDARNFLAEIRNWFFSAGSGFGGASYEFITGHIGEWLGWITNAVNDKGGGIIGAINSAKTDIGKKLDGIIKAIGAIPSGQHGAVLTRPGLVMTHGTPSAPEFVIPSGGGGLRLAAATAGAGRSIVIQNAIHIDGTLITDREYTRQRLIPEILAALGSNELKGLVQRALGI
jgi:predicted  nucleic acid-binding Zn-ribbon protein